MRFFLNREELLAFLRSLGPFAVVGFILVQALQVVIAPIPGEATGLLGGYLYDHVSGTIYSTIGLTIGSYIAFSISRAFGRPFVDKFVSKTTMARFEYLLHHKGAFLVFLLFLIPGLPKDALCYVLGLGHLSTMEFIVISGTGRLFGTALLTVSGDYLRHQQYYRLSILAGVAVIVVFLAMAYRDKIERLFRKLHVMEYRKRKKANRPQSSAKD
ncbi:MAG: TVP38/TMEM64 family protein [Nitrospirae bacterium]|nr:TVP38/TMEM64 family protein [Nitrospirota bacterium]